MQYREKFQKIFQYLSLYTDRYLYKKVNGNLLFLKLFRTVCLARVKQEFSSKRIGKWLLLKHTFEFYLQIYSSAIGLDRNSVARVSYGCSIHAAQHGYEDWLRPPQPHHRPRELY